MFRPCTPESSQRQPKIFPKTTTVCVGLSLQTQTTGQNLSDPKHVEKSVDRVEGITTFTSCDVANAKESCGAWTGDPEDRDGVKLDMLKTCMEFAKERINAKRRFLFEHSWNRWSWKHLMNVDVAPLEGVQTVERHMCANGHQAVDTDGSAKLTKQPTGLDDTPAHASQPPCRFAVRT